MDLRTRKLITVYKALHQRDDDHRLYVPRKEGGRGFIINEDSVDASIQRLEDYKEKPGGRPITATRNNNNDTRISGTEITRKQKWEEIQLSGRFIRIISNISHKKKWT